MKIKLAILLFFVLGTVSLTAQPAFDPDVDDVAPLPGIALALAAGVMVGIREIRRRKL
jgi:hypothetical protein